MYSSDMYKSEFEKELAATINKHSQENGSNTPDFILARFLNNCLSAFNQASRRREQWYGKELKIGGIEKVPSEKAIHIAARVWCDQDMGNIVMDKDAAECIANIIDDVIESQSEYNSQPMTLKDLIIN